MSAALSLIWIGLLIGVSFIATPVKFRAETITQPVALDVGRVTFALFGRIEGTLSLILLLLAFDFSDGLFRANAIVSSVIIAAIVVFQILWVRPVLDRRVQEIIDGADPPKSKAHTLYIGLEVAKLALLAIVALSA